MRNGLNQIQLKMAVKTELIKQRLLLTAIFILGTNHNSMWLTHRQLVASSVRRLTTALQTTISRFFSSHMLFQNYGCLGRKPKRSSKREPLGTAETELFVGLTLSVVQSTALNHHRFVACSFCHRKFAYKFALALIILCHIKQQNGLNAFNKLSQETKCAA